MQLKGLVRFFTVALILICVYQLSFTWMVHNHENSMQDKAASWLKKAYPTPEQKYGGNSSLAAAYSDSLKEFQKVEYDRLLDSTRDKKIGPFGLTTYQKAKDNELQLGLDLQGGMSVTMEVGMDGLVHTLSGNSNDPVIVQSIEAATARRANGNADYITLFGEEFTQRAAGKKLAPYFITKSGGKVKYNSTDDQVLTYLRSQSSAAFQSTYRILRTRIDRFGVASPTINPDEKRGTITIELAGANDPERVRHYLQSTANLQFFEVYNVSEIGEALGNADKTLSALLKGNKGISDSLKATTAKTDSAKNNTTAQANTTRDSGKVATLSDIHAANTAAASKTGVDSVALMKEQNPIMSILAPARGQQAENGQVQFPSFIGYIAKEDTPTLNKYLAMDVVRKQFPSNLAFMYGKPDTDPNTPAASKNILQLFAIKTLADGGAPLEGEHVSDAKQDYDERGRVAIKMTMDAVGTHTWAQMTEKNIGRPIAIVLDNLVYSAPFVNGVIPNGSSEISGSYSVTEAQDLSDILQSGKLPAPAKIVQEQIVGPTLGGEAITGGMMAFGISFLVIFILMVVYYNTAGWIANIALVLNLLFTIGVLSSMGFTLTAPGIAGLVLTIGMAVDANVIIFERIKEEITKGETYLEAVSNGYKRSYAPILDGHVTSLLTAIILAYFGLGPVLGFATTQIIGLLLSLFTGIMVTRMISDMYTTKGRHFEYFTKISRKVFTHKQFNFVGKRKYAYIISVFVVILGIASLFYGFDKGVEFAGGRSYTVRFDKAPKIEDVRNDLKSAFGEFPIIKTVNTANQLNITTSYLINSTDQATDNKVEEALFKGLQKYLPEGLNYQTFDTKYKQSSQTVLPTISKELEQGATKATIVAIIIICLYIFIRFRDWRYSVGTIISLLHDVLVTLIVFSFFRKIVPFPLEIDQHFIAAVLTVIGFSMNDTVIVYDRIREDSKIMLAADKTSIINRAINQTLSRTVMTSLTVFLTILILFIFGGEVTRGFAFAMLIGVITGTYSSIFVAAPVLMDIAKGKPLGKKHEHHAAKVEIK
ncbi:MULTISPECIES: protein translocase subunit SecDF [Chitinophagaceae]